MAVITVRTSENLRNNAKSKLAAKGDTFQSYLERHLERLVSTSEQPQPTSVDDISDADLSAVVKIPTEERYLVSECIRLMATPDDFECGPHVRAILVGVLKEIYGQRMRRWMRKRGKGASPGDIAAQA